LIHEQQQRNGVVDELKESVSETHLRQYWTGETREWRRISRWDKRRGNVDL